MARRFEEGKRDYRFLMKLFLSLKLPPVENTVLEEEVQWGERDVKDDGGRCGEYEMDVGMNVRVPFAPSYVPYSPPANLQCNKNSFFLSLFFFFENN